MSGRPLPAVSWLVTVQPLRSVALHAVEQRAAADADAGRVLNLRGQQMPLIEVRRRPLGVEVQPVLRDRGAAQAHAGERARIVASPSPACTAPSPSGRCAAAAAAGTGRRAASSCRSTSGRRSPTGHAGHGFAAPAGYVFGRNSCIRWLPFVPRYVAVIVSDAGRSRCTEHLPVLRVADAEVRIDGERVRRRAGRRREPVGERERIARRCSRRSTPSTAAAAAPAASRSAGRRRCCDRCRSRRGRPATIRHRPPGDADARLDAAPVGGSASRIRCRSASRSSATTADRREARRDVEVRRAGRTARSIGASYSQRTPALHRERRADPPVVGDVGVVGRAREGTCRRCRTRSSSCAEGRAGSRRDRSPVALPVNVKLPRASCCDRMSQLLTADVAAERDVVPAVAPEALGAPAVRRGCCCDAYCALAEPGDAARELQARRAPVDRILVVAGDAGVARHVGAVGEVRRHVVGQPRELIAERAARRTARSGATS